MSHIKQNINHMNQLLDDLVETSKKMRDVSMQVIAEEELAPLQKKQQVLLREIENIDEMIHQNYLGQIDKSTHDHFHSRLIEFQKFNLEFIENFTRSKGLIQFDLEHLPNETNSEIPSLSFIHKMGEPTKRAQAINLKDTKKKNRGACPTFFPGKSVVYYENIRFFRSRLRKKQFYHA